MPIGQKDWIKALDRERPVLIAGPTASGKSSLALEIAARTGGPIVNADALQVFSNWRILTARPGAEDEARHPHALYGHIGGETPYSVGDWLRDIRPLLNGAPPVIVGGTGLYFTALTEGLADIPSTPPGIRALADARLKTEGISTLLAEIDAETKSRIDTMNPMRVQRAWEVQAATGQGLAAWQDRTGPADLLLRDVQPMVLDAPKEWLTPRLALRLDRMVVDGALDEARAHAETWSPEHPSSKAIGAHEFVAHVRGELSLDDALAAALVQTRQYAKRQRSWFRGRMRAWRWIDATTL